MNCTLKLRTSDRKAFLSFVTTFVLGALLFAVPSSRQSLAQSGERPPMSLLGKAGPQQNANLLAEDSPDALAAGNWLTASPYPTLIARYGFAQVGQNLYIISGVSEGSIQNAVRRYNATTNVWTARANIPVGLEAPAAAFFNGKIYVAGGSTGGSGTNNFQIYDIDTNTWSAGPNMPRVTWGAAAGVFNGNVYVAGGDSPATTAVSIYNIAGLSWSAGTAAPSAYILGGYVQVGQFLYVIGSFTPDAANNSSVSMRLDMATGTWSTGPVWTPQRADFALAAAGSKLYAIGGDASGVDGNGYFTPSAQVDELDTTAWPAGSWTASPDNLPSARQGNQAGFLSGARAGGEIWSTGGFTTDTVYLNEHLYRAVDCLNYAVAQSTGTIVPGTTNTGNVCDDCTTTIALPFPVAFYGTTFTSANLSSNGNLQFISNSLFFGNAALPNAAFNMAIFPFGDDLRTDAAGKGIFTTVQGVAPNRVFNIEWRVNSFTGGNSTNFELRLFEGSPVFDIVYGTTSGTFTGTTGVQRDTGSLVTQTGATNTNVPFSGTRRTFAPGCCPPITFNGRIGFNSPQYPGLSGTQTNRVTRVPPTSVCGVAKSFPGTSVSGSPSFDQYSFANDGPATCVTFSVYTACTGTQFIFPVAYLGSFNPANIAANYLGDPGGSPNPYRSFSVDVPANATVVLVVSEVTAGSPCPGYTVTVTGLKCPLELVSAASRKTHGGNPFEINLPLTGAPGVECRTGGAGGNHTMVFTFTTNVVSGSATVTTGTGTAGAASFAGNKMTVPLTGVSDQQKITVTLNGVTDTSSQVLPSTAVSMNVLLGDTSGNKAVNSSDVSQTKAQSGTAISAANFRSDTNISGTLNASDVSQVKANSGHAVP